MLTTFSAVSLTPIPLRLAEYRGVSYATGADNWIGKGDSLQRAMDARGCFGPSCGTNFKAQTIEQAFKCSVDAKVKENYDQCTYNIPIHPDIRE
jgi:hypothetical protein